MKKFALILGMITCLAGLTACGESNVVTESKFSSDMIHNATDSYVAAIDELASQGKTVDDLKVMLSQYNMTIEDYYGMDEAVLSAAVENYGIALKDLGAYAGVEDVSYTEDDEILAINATIKGTNVAPDGNARTANVKIDVNPKDGKVTSILTNVNFTFGEMMENAAMNTLLGMGTVFVVLIILMFIISLFKIVNNLQNRSAGKKTEEAEKTDSVDKAVAQIEANEQTQDDTELIAVIAAAIAASEGAASADGYVVRSIRRRY